MSGSLGARGLCILTGVLLSLVCPAYVQADDTGFKNPSATGDDYTQWSNAANAYTSNNSDATEDQSGQQQDWYNLGFSIPGGSTIDGIQIDVEGNNQWEANGADIEVSWDGGTSYTSTGKGAIWPTDGVDSYQTFGGAADTWGRTWSDSELSDANFRVRLTKTGSEDFYNFEVDHIQVKVFYSATPSAALTGTLSDNATEDQIVAGAETLIITLANDTWDATIGADNAKTTALIAGLDSAQSETKGWNAVVKANLDYNDVTRTSDTVVTITFWPPRRPTTSPPPRRSR